VRIHPAFYPDSGLWEVGFGASRLLSESLRGLAAALPPETVIVDYHPLGAPVVPRGGRLPEGEPLRSGLRTNYRGRRSVAERVKAATAAAAR
jgi:hypothetical protein